MKKQTELFFLFARISLFTVGGGLAMLALVQREMRDRQWLDDREFLDVFSAAQSLPGVMIVNVATLVGYRVAGASGGVCAALGAVLPPFLSILFIAVFLSRAWAVDPLVQKFFRAVRPAAVALIVSALIDLTRSSRMRLRSLPVALLTAAAVSAGAPPAWIIAAALATGAGYAALAKP